MAKWLCVCTLVGVTVLPPPAAAQPAPSCGNPGEPLLYIGDRDFPPYEYLTVNGEPAGFNVEVLRAVSRVMDRPIHIRLIPGYESRQARAAGEADLFSAGYEPERERQFDFLESTTTIRSSVILLPGRSRYPASASDVRQLRIAIQEGSPSASAFDTLSPAARPQVVITPSHRASIGMLLGGDVDAAAGSGATLRWFAREAGVVEPMEVPMNSRPYMLATRQGCLAALARVSEAVSLLKSQGVIDQIGDRTLGAPDRQPPWTWRQVAVIALIFGVVVAIALAWNWALRRTVRARTRALRTALDEQQRLTEVIQSNEDRLAFAMDVVGEGVWEWDLVTDQIQASTRWAGSFGYRPEEAPTSYSTWMSFVHPDDRDRVAAAARAHINGKAPRFETTYRVPRKGGDWIWVVDRGRIVRRDESGKPLRMVGALKDITVQLAAERALHEAKDAAEENSRAKSAFLATISHEMRTPLNAVIGTAALLEHSTLSDDQRELLRLLKRSGSTLLAVVNDVLDFTKTEAGRIEIDVHPFDLQQTVRDSVSLVEQAAREKALHIETRCAPESSGWFLGDDTRVRQILLNLVSNAVKFTETGGVTVDVTANDTADEQVALRIAVTDSGIGIPADRMERLFQPFSQVDSSTTRRFGGTGLGLAISKRLAELMGGTIEVTTKEHRGSTFTLSLLLKRTEAPHPQAAVTPAPRVGARGLKVILAEDNAVNQLVQVRMLRQLGYEADVVANGLELVQAFEKKEYDLVLLDIQMPVMDGIEAARELRRRGFHRLRIVALTADVTAETRRASVDVGIEEYVSKPLQLDVLADVLARAEARVTSVA